MENTKNSVGHFFKEIYEIKKQKNQKYSLRAFARDLNIPPGRFSEILSGKRNLTLELARNIASVMGFNSKERKKLFLLVAEQKTLKSKPPSPQEFLRPEDFSKISHWKYFALLGLLEISKDKVEIMDLAKRLSIEMSQAQEMIDTLLNLEIIEKTELGFQVVNTSITTDQDKLDYYIQRCHKDLVFYHMLQMEKIAPTLREYQTLIFTMDPKDLKNAKKYIRNFMIDFQKKFMKTKDAQVYGFSLQLTPLT